jgi:hypothetical protein
MAKVRLTSKTFSKTAIPLTAAVLALGIGVVTGPPASATVATGYVSGTGAWADDWNDEGPVSRYSNTRSNATCLWQTILYADGEFGATGIDGIFGAETERLTVSWQIGKGKGYLDPDGSAGPDTWNVAMQQVKYKSTDANGDLRFVYDGNGHTGDMTTSHDFELARNTAGNWKFKTPSGNWHMASYTGNDCA